jgi:hypothetical protein
MSNNGCALIGIGVLLMFGSLVWMIGSVKYGMH